jgi:predicted PurR-regulated permease PerM
MTRVDECTTTRAMSTAATTRIANTIDREPIRARSAPRCSGESCRSEDIRSYSTAVAAAREGSRAPRGIRQIELDFHTYVVFGLSVGGAYMLLALFTSASRTFTWLVIGTLLALALDPLVGAVERRFSVGRRNAVCVVFGGFLVFTVGAGALLIPRAVDQAQNFSRDVPKVIDSIGTLPIIGGRLKEEHVPERVRTWLEELPERLGGDPRPIEQFGRSAASSLLAGFFTLLVTIALLLDGQRFLAVVREAVPRRRQRQADRVGGLLYRIVGRYFAGSLLVALCAATGILIVGLTLRIPLAPLAALWVMFTNLIPQIGGLLGGVPFVLLGLSRSPLTGVICLVWFLGYQQFENHLLQPAIVGQAVNLSPPITMMAALIGGSTAGVPGALVAVPVAGLVKAIYLELRGAPTASAADESHPALLTRLLHRGRHRPAQPDAPADQDQDTPSA